MIRAVTQVLYYSGGNEPRRACAVKLYYFYVTVMSYRGEMYSAGELRKKAFKQY